MRIEIKDAFDYEVLGSCQFGVYAGYDNEVEDCGEPAYYKVWGSLLVCQKHFKLIEKEESKGDKIRS